MAPSILKLDCATVPGVALPEGVFFTVNEFWFSQASCARFSSKVRTSEVPFTVALESDGAMMSGVLLVTAWSVKLATALPEASASLFWLPVSGRV